MIDITKHQFLQFIRTKKDTDEKLTKATHHYLAYYDRYASTGKKGNWNFAALLPGWFFYRRMYSLGFCLLIINKLMGKVEIPEAPEALIANIVIFMLSIAFIILCTRYADYAYLRFASEEISKGRTTSGVNRSVVVFFAIIVLAYFYLLIYSKIQH